MANGKSASNFVDPIGLARRMLLGKNPIGRSLLIREALKRLTGPLDWWMSRHESRLPNNPVPSELPILLIVGGPRTGSTLFYQIITHCFDVSSFQNLVEYFPRSPITATRWLSKDGVAARDSFSSFYGNTRRLREVNDGFPIWDRYFGDDRYVADLTLAENQGNELGAFFDQWQTAFPRPFVNKNNRNTDCVGFLARQLPRAKFVVIDRDPFFEAQSIIFARQFVQGDRRKPWGLYSRSVATSSSELGYVDDVARQVLYLRRRIQEQLSSMEPERVLVLDYSDLCANIVGVLSRFSQHFPEFKRYRRSPFPELPQYKESRENRLSERESNLLRNCLEKLSEL